MYTSLMKIDSNEHEGILKVISHIQFPQLRDIYLFSNNIESIEGLHWLRMPAL